VNFLPLDKAECAVSDTVSSSFVPDSCDENNVSKSVTRMGVDSLKSGQSVRDGGLAKTHEDSESVRPDDGLSLDDNVSSSTIDSCARTSDWVSGLPDKCSQLGSVVSLSNGCLINVHSWDQLCL